MYAIGEYLVHPGQGVCQVKDVTDGADGVYQLLPMGQRRPICISFPLANESRLRPVLSRAEAEKIIDEYPSMALDEFSARNNALEEEHFKQEMRSGTCRDSVRIAKTFHARMADLSAHNKRSPVAYTRIFKQARERSCMELAVALDCTPEDVALVFERFDGENPSDN